MKVEFQFVYWLLIVLSLGFGFRYFFSQSSRERISPPPFVFVIIVDHILYVVPCENAHGVIKMRKKLMYRSQLTAHNSWLFFFCSSFCRFVLLIFSSFVSFLFFSASLSLFNYYYYKPFTVCFIHSNDLTLVGLCVVWFWSWLCSAAVYIDPN